MRKVKKRTLSRTLKRSWSNPPPSVSQLISIAAYKKHNKELVRNNQKLAMQLQETLCKNFLLNRQIKDYNKNTNQVMFARLKLKEMANSVTKLVTDMTEVTQYLDGSLAMSSNMFENSPSNYKLNMKAPNVSCIEEVSVLSSASAEGTNEEHLGDMESSEESTNRKCSKDNTTTPEIQPSTSDANLNIPVDVPPLLFIGDPGEKVKDKTSSKGKSSRKSVIIEAGSLTPKLELDLDIFNPRRTSSRRQTKTFILQNTSKRTNSKKRSTAEKCISPEEQGTHVKKVSGNSLSANKKDQFCDTEKDISCNKPDINNKACHISPPAVVVNFPAKLAKDVLSNCTMLLCDDMELTEVLPTTVQFSAKNTATEASGSKNSPGEKPDDCENVENQENDLIMDCVKEKANISEHLEDVYKETLSSPDVVKEAVQSVDLDSFLSDSFSPGIKLRRNRKKVSYVFFSSDDDSDDYSDFQEDSVFRESLSKNTRNSKGKFFENGVTTNRLSIKKSSLNDENKAVKDLSVFDLDVSDSKTMKKPRMVKSSKTKKDNIQNFFSKPSQKSARSVFASDPRSKPKVVENVDKPNERLKEAMRKSIVDGKKCLVEGENKRISSILRHPDTPRSKSKRVSFSALDEVLNLTSNNMSENKRIRRTSKSAAEFEEIPCTDANMDCEKGTTDKPIPIFNKETAVFTFSLIDNSENCPPATNVPEDNVLSSSCSVGPQKYHNDKDNGTHDKVQVPLEELPDSNNKKTSSSICVSKSDNEPNQDIALDLNKFVEKEITFNFSEPTALPNQVIASTLNNFVENEITFNFSEPTELYTFPLNVNDNNTIPSIQSVVPATTEDKTQCSKLKVSQQKFLKNIEQRTLEKNPLLKETSRIDVKKQIDTSETLNFPEKNKRPMLPKGKSKIVPQQEFKQDTDKGTSNCLAKTLVKSDKKEGLKADRKKKIENSETLNFPEKIKQPVLPKSKMAGQQELIQDSDKSSSDCLAKTLVKSDKKAASKTDDKEKVENSDKLNIPEKSKQPILPKSKIVAQINAEFELMQDSDKGSSDCLAKTSVKSDKKVASKTDDKQKVEISDSLNFPEKNIQPVLPKSKIVVQQELMQDSEKGTSDCLAKTLVKSDKKVSSKTDHKQKVESSDTLNIPEKIKQPMLPKSKIVAQEELMQGSEKGASDCLAKTLVKSDKKVSSKTDHKQKVESSDTLNIPEKIKQPMLPKSKIVAQEELMQGSEKGASDCLAKTLVKSDKKVSSKTDDKKKVESSDTLNFPKKNKPSETHPKKKIEISESLPKQLQLPSSMCFNASEQLRNKSNRKKDNLNSENNQISNEQRPHSIAKETQSIDESKAQLASKEVCEAKFGSDILTEASDVPDQSEQQLNVHDRDNKSGKQIKDGTALERTKSSQLEVPLVNERESDDFQLENIKLVARKKTKLYTDDVKENIMSSDQPLDVSFSDLQVESSDRKSSRATKKTQNKRKQLSQTSSGNIILKKVRNSIIPKSVESSPVLKDVANMDGVECNTRTRRSKVKSYKEVPLNSKLRRP